MANKSKKGSDWCAIFFRSIPIFAGQAAKHPRKRFISDVDWTEKRFQNFFIVPFPIWKQWKIADQSSQCWSRFLSISSDLTWKQQRTFPKIWDKSGKYSFRRVQIFPFIQQNWQATPPFPIKKSHRRAANCEISPSTSEPTAQIWGNTSYLYSNNFVVFLD